MSEKSCAFCKGSVGHYPVFVIDNDTKDYLPCCTGDHAEKYHSELAHTANVRQGSTRPELFIQKAHS
jgi:hypothetical protein